MRLIDADVMREEWLENGQNEYVYDTNAILDSIDQQPTIKLSERRFVFLSEIYRVIEGHSNYHGDNLLSALTCIAEGKKVNPVIPLEDMRPHGNWIGLGYEGYINGNPVYDYWECSVCRNGEDGEDVPEQNPYCRSCGAKMDK